MEIGSGTRSGLNALNVSPISPEFEHNNHLSQLEREHVSIKALKQEEFNLNHQFFQSQPIHVPK